MALLSRRHMRGEQRFGGEESHLGVIGDGAEFSVSWSVVADSRFAVSTDNFVEVQEFHGSAEGVAGSAAKQASAEAGSHAGIRWNPGKGHFSLEPWERLSFEGQDTAIRQKSASI